MDKYKVIMTGTIDDTKTGTIALTEGEEPEKKMPWMLYLVVAGIAFALLSG